MVGTGGTSSSDAGNGTSSTRILADVDAARHLKHDCFSLPHAHLASRAIPVLQLLPMPIVDTLVGRYRGVGVRRRRGAKSGRDLEKNPNVG